MRLNLHLGILAFFLLCFSCISRSIPRIEDDLRARSAEALANAGLSVADLRFSGRDAILAGPVASEELRRRAEDIVSRVYGIRAVDNQLAVAEPAPGPAELQQSLDRWISGKVISFVPGSDEISDEGRALLDQLVPILLKNDRQEIEIGGHTDASGNPSANENLSQRRADAVKQHLVGCGVGPNLLTTAGYGSTRAVADNETAAGRMANRRIASRVKEGR